MLNTMSGEGILYLYFPTDFNKNKAFYLFLIEDYDNGAFTKVELDQIDNILNNFKCINDI